MTDPRPSQALLGPLLPQAALDALFEQQTVGLAIVDRDLRYVAINDALAAMNRLTAADHLGRTVREVLPEAADDLERVIGPVLEGAAVSDLELTTSDPSGERRFRVSYLPVRDGDQVAGVLAVVVDVTGGRRAEHALRITQERLQLALEGTKVGTYEWDVTTDSIRWSDNLGEMWGRGRGWVPVDFGAYLETIHAEDRDALASRVQASLDEPGRSYELQFRVLLPDGGVRWMQTRGHVARGEDGRPEALLGLVSDIDDRRMEQIAAEFLAEASLVLAESLDPVETLQQVAELALGELADWCAIHVVGDDGLPRPLVVAHRDPAMVRLAHELEERFPSDPEAPGGVPEVIRTRRSELIAEIPDELLAEVITDAERLRIIRELQLRSAMIVPLLAHGDAIGAISFFYAGPDRHYSEQTLALAEELGRRAGLALANARLHRAQQHANERLRELGSITDVALSQLELDDLLGELLVRVREILDADFAVCLLLDPEQQALTVRATIGLESATRRALRIPVGHGIAGRIVEQDGPVVIADVPAAEPVSDELRDAAASLLGVSLRVEGRTVGVLHVSTRHPRTFSDDDAELLTLVGDRVARAVDQAAAYERVRDTAITLQRSLLPASVPDIEGLQLATRYIPGHSTEIGGDWYDVVDLPDGRHAICVGDVVGRGVAAAAVMGRLRSSLRAYLHVADGPVEALTMLDDLVAAGEDVPFATVLLAVVDSTSGAVELCTAGHPPPILCDGDGCRLVDTPVGLPIGAPTAARHSGRAQLEVGSSLLLYTDGLVERRGTGIEERLAALCRSVSEGPKDPEALLDHVVDAMLGEHAGGDDVALVGAWRRAS